MVTNNSYISFVIVYLPAFRDLEAKSEIIFSMSIGLSYLPIGFFIVVNY